MSTVVKDLGAATAYGYAVEKGYTGTEAEFAELMASYATVGQTAVTAAETATTKASEAATSATTATNKATEATTAATTATNKAAEAQADADAAALDASQALSAASTATTKATEATTAAATAVSAKDDAVSANTAAQSAKTAAQTAQTGAETAAASVEASAEQIATNAEDISQLKSKFTALDNVVNGEKILVDITEMRSRIITSSGQLSNAQDTYSCFVFDLEADGKYSITGSNNEVLRIAFSNSNADTSRALDSTRTSADASKYEFINSNGWDYCYIFGVTPEFPNATFSVTQIDDADSLTNIVNNLEKKAVEIGDLKQYVKNGTATGGNNEITVNDCACYITTKHAYSYINLGDISVNTNFSDSSNLLSSISDTFDNGDVVDVNVDVVINSNTFSQFGLGLKTPNSTTTKLLFFNVSNSAVDSSGKFNFSRQFKLEAGDTFGIPFIYLADTSASSNNPLTMEGTISVAKHQQAVDRVAVDGTTYYLKQWTDDDATILARGNVRSVGALHKNGIHIVDGNNVPVELRGVGLHHILQYSNLHSWKSFHDLKRMGVNMIRCSVYLSDRTYASSDNEPAYGYISHPDETKAEIERIVKNCIDLGLYVIIDWHDLDGHIDTYKTEALEFFDYYSEKYANVPNIIYEFANEPYFDDSATIASYVRDVRAIVLANTNNPIMLVGQPAPLDDGNGNKNWNVYDRCSALYSALSALGITDVFVSPHNYGGSIVTELSNCISNNIPVFVSEWGNSDSDGDGSYHDTAALAQINYCHENAIAQSLWKYTDQTMKSSLLVNYGIINSERYASGFTSNDLSHNGVLLLGRYYDFIRDEWIVRAAIQ